MPDASAYPKKRFFIEMFTRDIPLLDCILDLIDNCVDGLARTDRLDMHTLSNDIFGKKKKPSRKRANRPYVKINFDGKVFKIEDNCGGIEYKYALDDVFNFGHSTKRLKEYLGVYGVGMKRALFKMGDKFQIESKTVDNGFKCELNVPAWMKMDSKIEDWTIPLNPVRAATSLKSAGTAISISKLKEDVASLMKTSRFEEELINAISRVYAFIVDKYIKISVNGIEVKAFRIPVAEPYKGEISYEELDHNGVKIRIFATLVKDKPTKENSGWYVACNGRLILLADTTKVTGWGVNPMPIWVPKYTSFIGLVFFESKDALALPWTTTKRDVNRESAVYRKALSRMAVKARPILSFCNRKYPPDVDQEPIEREIASQMKQATIGELVQKGSTGFKVQAPIKPKRTTVKVQYDAKISEIEKIRKHLRQSRMGAYKIGEYTFEYYLRQEGLK